MSVRRVGHATRVLRAGCWAAHTGIVRPNLAAILPDPADGTAPYPVPAQLIDVLDDPREGVQGRVLHLMDASGAHFLHAVDHLGRLHRTDGPALVKVTPTTTGRSTSTADAPTLRAGGYASTAWWVDGRPIDDAPGTPTRIARLSMLGSLDDDELAALQAHLPHGFRVTPDAVVHAPSSVRHALTEADLLNAWGYSDGVDPLVSLALTL